MPLSKPAEVQIPLAPTGNLLDCGKAPCIAAAAGTSMQKWHRAAIARSAKLWWIDTHVKTTNAGYIRIYEHALGWKW